MSAPINLNSKPSFLETLDAQLDELLDVVSDCCCTCACPAPLRDPHVHPCSVLTHVRLTCSTVRAGELQLAVIQRGRDRFEVEVLDGLLRRACTVTEALEKATMQFDVRALAFSDCMGTRRSSTQNSASATH